LQLAASAIATPVTRSSAGVACDFFAAVRDFSELRPHCLKHTKQAVWTTASWQLQPFKSPGLYNSATAASAALLFSCFSSWLADMSMAELL
jgi:hypothetical protein